MKFLGSFIVLAILNLVTVFAGPPPHATIRDSNFEYYIQYDGSNQAYITNVLDKKATTLSVNPYVMHQGTQYDVVAFSSGLTGSAVTKLVIPHYIYHDFSIWGNVLKEAKNLKELQINSLNNVNFYEDTFKGVNPELQIHGQGVDFTITRYAKQFLKDNYPDLIKDYSNAGTYDKKCALYTIAKIINKKFTYSVSASNGNNGASALLLKRGNMVGLSRVVRILAIAAGLNGDDILVGGDDMVHGCNYVKFGRKWYVLDSVKQVYNDRDLCSTTVFQTLDSFIKSTNGYYGRLYQGNPDTFVVYHGKYGCPYENVNPEKEYFKQWLAKNNKGKLA